MKKISRILFIFLGVMCLEMSAFSQQDAQFSHYMFNSMNYNPGYAGLEGVTRITGIFRKQWLGYSSTTDAPGGTSPTSAVITANTLLPFLNQRTGVGANFVYDSKGPINTTELQISLAYHFKIKTGKLGVGLRSGFRYENLNTNWYQVIDRTDPIYTNLLNAPASQVKPDIAAGLYWQTPKYYIGVSASHFSGTKYTYGIDTSIASKLSSHAYVTAGYTFNFSGGMLKLTPNAFFQTDTRNYTYLFGATLMYNDKFYGGISARESIANKEVTRGGSTVANDDIIFLIGMNLMKNNALRLGYAFDYVTSGVQAKTRTSHEIMLSYVIPTKWLQLKPIVRTPRYRQEEY
ncbi:MAG: type IX secretion system membrane protein SprP [Cytophaga sp.]|uniref:type IX secretion system membrane protein SprP n=1 Tax=Cytophaga sp. TaxID=29535 RepID=UPI003F81BDF7